MPGTGASAFAMGAAGNGVFPVDLLTHVTGSALGASTSLFFALKADGSTLYTTDIGGSQLVVIDVATKTITHTVAGVSSYSCALSADESILYVGAGAAGVQEIDTTTFALGETISYPGAVFPVGMLVVGTKMYVGEVGGEISVIDLVAETGTNIVATGAPVYQFVLSHDGATVFASVGTSGAPGAVQPITVSTDTAGTSIPVGTLGGAAFLAISPDGSTLYASLPGDGKVAPIDTTTHVVGTLIPVGTNPEGLSFPGITYAELTGSTHWSVGFSSTPDLIFLTLQLLTGSMGWSVDFNTPDYIFLTLQPITGSTAWSVDFNTPNPTLLVLLGGETDWTVDFNTPNLTLLIRLLGSTHWTVDFVPSAFKKYIYLSNWKEIIVPDPLGGPPTTRKLVYGPNMSVDFVPILDLVPGPPDVPTGLGGIVVGDGNEILVTWHRNAADGITYTLDGSNDGTTWSFLAALYDQFVYDESGLGYSHTRHYRLKATNPYGDSAWCTPIVVTTLSAPPVDPIPPFVPPFFPPAAIRRVVVTNDIVLPGGMV